MTVTGARARAGAAWVIAALVTAGCGTTAAHRAAPGVGFAGRSRTLAPCAAARAPARPRLTLPAGPAAVARGGGPVSRPAAGPQPAGLPAVTLRPGLRVSAPAVTRVRAVRLGVPGLLGTGHQGCRAPLPRRARRCPPGLLRRLRRGAQGGRRPLLAIPFACVMALRAR